MPMMSSTLGIYRGLLLAIIFIILLIAFVSAAPSPQGIPAHQNIRGNPQDVALPCEFKGGKFFSRIFLCFTNAHKQVLDD